MDDGRSEEKDEGLFEDGKWKIEDGRLLGRRNGPATAFTRVSRRVL